MPIQFASLLISWCA